MNAGFFDVEYLRKELLVQFGADSQQCQIKPYTHNESWVIRVSNPEIDLIRLRKFVKKLPVPVYIKTTVEVDVAHAAKYVPEIAAAIPRLHCFWVGLMLSNGSILYRIPDGFYVKRNLARFPIVNTKLVLSQHPNTLILLALQVARICDYTVHGLNSFPDYLEDAMTPEAMRIIWIYSLEIEPHRNGSS